MKNILPYCLILLMVIFTPVAFSDEYSSITENENSKGSVYEIRSYHYDPSKFDAFSQWLIEDAAPFLRANLDVVGIWGGAVDKPIIAGTNPMELSLGSANVTWIIRWDSLEERKTVHKKVFGGDDWQKIWANHPDTNGYKQVEVRFVNQY